MGVRAVQILFLNSEMNKIRASVWHLLMSGDCDFRYAHWSVHLCNELTDSIIMQHEPLILAEFCCFPNNCHCGKQDRQCRYNGTRRAYLQSLLLWKNNKYYIFRMCVCIRCYLACNPHAPYCHPRWPVRLYNIFHIILWMAQFSGEKTLTERKMGVAIVSTSFVRKKISF